MADARNMYDKWVQKSMDFEIENRDKSMKEGVKKLSIFGHRFGIDFGRFWGGFWEALEAQMDQKLGK